MNIEILSEINYITEETALLKSIARPDGHPEGLLKFKQILERSIASKALAHRFNIVEKILREGEKAFKNSMDDVKYYFQCFPQLQISLADILLLLSPWEQDLRAGDLKNHIRSLSFEERCRRFLTICGASFAPDPPGPSKMLPKDAGLKHVSQWLEQSPLLPENKWQIFSVFMNMEDHLPKLLRLMEKAEAVLEKTKASWHPLIEDFGHYWRQQVAQRDVIHDIKNVFHIDLQRPQKTSVVRFCPLMIFMNTLSISLADEWGIGDCDLYSLGLIYGEDIYLDFDSPKDKETQLTTALQILKLLSDKSKFEILTSVKKAPAYGAQLARQLNLTTATISYHMNALIQEQLIQLERNNHRIYYSINQETIKHLIEYLEKELL